jgi:hypothetical protein
MRDRETIDSELRLVSLARRSIREQGGPPSCRPAARAVDYFCSATGHKRPIAVAGAGSMSIPALCGPLSHQQHRVEKVPRVCRDPHLSDISETFET